MHIEKSLEKTVWQQWNYECVTYNTINPLTVTYKRFKWNTFTCCAHAYCTIMSKYTANNLFLPVILIKRQIEKGREKTFAPIFAALFTSRKVCFTQLDFCAKPCAIHLYLCREKKTSSFVNATKSKSWNKFVDNGDNFNFNKWICWKVFSISYYHFQLRFVQLYEKLFEIDSNLFQMKSIKHSQILLSDDMTLLYDASVIVLLAPSKLLCNTCFYCVPLFGSAYTTIWNQNEQQFHLTWLFSRYMRLGCFHNSYFKIWLSSEKYATMRWLVIFCLEIIEFGSFINKWVLIDLTINSVSLRKLWILIPSTMKPLTITA